jgi:diaminopimelate epimerase
VKQSTFVGDSLKQLPFTKMQALGNDFVIVDTQTLSPAQIRWIADRRCGIGCDQVIVVKPSTTADAALSFYNADGSEALACGNGTRCVAKYLGKDAGTLKTPSFLSQFWRTGDSITISLQPPHFLPPLPQGHGIDIGNPHLVIFTDDVDSVPINDLAPALQPPEGTNIEWAQVTSPSTIKVRVWERGVGITPACGSGACAVGILGLKLGLVKHSPVSIEMDGGTLTVAWATGDPALLTGPAEFCFKGIVDLP